VVVTFTNNTALGPEMVGQVAKQGAKPKWVKTSACDELKLDTSAAQPAVF